jgi:hypothetical protein
LTTTTLTEVVRKRTALYDLPRGRVRLAGDTIEIAAPLQSR